MNKTMLKVLTCSIVEQVYFLDVPIGSGVVLVMVVFSLWRFKGGRTLTADFGSSDLQATAEKQTQSLKKQRYISKAQQPQK